MSMKPLEYWLADSLEAVQRFHRNARECSCCGLWGYEQDEFTKDPNGDVCDGCLEAAAGSERRAAGDVS